MLENEDCNEGLGLLGDNLNLIIANVQKYEYNIKNIQKILYKNKNLDVEKERNKAKKLYWSER